jgi:hypothetical protein
MRTISSVRLVGYAQNVSFGAAAASSARPRLSADLGVASRGRMPTAPDREMARGYGSA